MEETKKKLPTIMEKYYVAFRFHDMTILTPESPDCEVKLNIDGETDNFITIKYIDSEPVYYNIFHETTIMIGKINPYKKFEPPLLNINVEEKEFACKIKEIWNRPHIKNINEIYLWREKR